MVEGTDDHLKEIFLIRHGESLDNCERRIQGWRGSSLSERGRKDAQCAGERLSHCGLEALYTSDLTRAAETAGIIGQAIGLIPIRTPSFREIHLGPWEGRTIMEVEENDKDAILKWRSDGRNPPHADIEPIRVFGDRLMMGLAEIVKGHEGNVGVVSHGGAISVMLTEILGIELIRIWQMPTENGSISRVTHDGMRFSVASYNETGHLLARDRPGMNTLG